MMTSTAKLNATAITTEASVLMGDSYGNDNCSVTNALNFWLPLVLCITGILGNILSFAIIHIGYRRTPMNILLKSLAIADSTYLLFEVVLEIIFKWMPLMSLNVIHVLWHAAKIAQYSSVWHLVVIGGFRYVAVCHPFKATRLCTDTRAYVSIVWLWLLSIALQLIPIWGQFEVISKTLETVWYLVVINALVFLFPFVLLLVFNYCILYILRNASQNIPHRNGGQEPAIEFYEVSKIVIAIASVFFITYWSYPLPSMDQYLFNGYLFDPSHDGKSCFTTFCETFLNSKAQFISSSTNFFIYSILRKSFRNKMREILCCQKRGKHIRQSYMVFRKTTTTQLRTAGGSNTMLTEIHAMNA